MSVRWNDLSRLGFSFFPIPKGQKRPTMKWEAYQERCPTDAEIASWKPHDSNVAIVTGAISGIVVLDVDSDEGEALVRENGVPETPTVETAKGRHRYFKHPGFKVRNFARRLTGCDLRGDGGYVVGPESIHPDGIVYKLTTGFDVPLADMPEWLIDATKKDDTRPPPHRSSSISAWAEKALDGELTRLLRAPEGERNNTLNVAAFNLGQIVGGGELHRDDVLAHLVRTAKAIGLPDAEAQASAASGLNAGASSPRRPPERPSDRRDRRTRSNVVPIEDAHAIRAGDPLPGTIDPIKWQDRPAPPRRWLVPQWVPDLATTLLYGDGGVGKSLLAQQLATHVALGRKFAGMEIPRRKTICIFCEDPEDELHRRQEAINARLACDAADLEDLRFIARPGLDSILMDFPPNEHGKETSLFEQVRRAALDFGAGFIIWDTVSDAFSGNENIRPQVRQFMSLFTRLAMDIDGAVLLCAHPSVAGRATGEAGSTQWSNSARSRLYLTRPDDNDDDGADPAERRLSRMKANYATTEDVIDLRWHEGAFVVKDNPEGIIRTIVRDKAERVFMAALAKLDEMGMTAAPSRKSGDNYAPRLIIAMKLADGTKSGDLERAMKRLLHDGRIRVEDCNRRKALVIVKP